MPFWSTVDNAWLDTARLDGEYWYRNLRQCVLFEPGVRALAGQGHRFFVEISAHPVLTMAIEETADAVEPVVALGTLRRDDGGRDRIVRAAGELFVHGGPVDLLTLIGDGPAADLPTYAFQRSRYWIDPVPLGDGWRWWSSAARNRGRPRGRRCRAHRVVVGTDAPVARRPRGAGHDPVPCHGVRRTRVARWDSGRPRPDRGTHPPGAARVGGAGHGADAGRRRRAGGGRQVRARCPHATRRLARQPVDPARHRHLGRRRSLAGPRRRGVATRWRTARRRDGVLRRRRGCRVWLRSGVAGHAHGVAPRRRVVRRGDGAGHVACGRRGLRPAPGVAGRGVARHRHGSRTARRRRTGPAGRAAFLVRGRRPLCRRGHRAARAVVGRRRRRRVRPDHRRPREPGSHHRFAGLQARVDGSRGEYAAVLVARCSGWSGRRSRRDRPRIRTPRWCTSTALCTTRSRWCSPALPRTATEALSWSPTAPSRQRRTTWCPLWNKHRCGAW